MSESPGKEECTRSNALDVIEAAAPDNKDSLSESLASTAQWVAKHADIKLKFEKIRSEFEQRCSSFSKKDRTPNVVIGADKTGRVQSCVRPPMQRRASESSCKYEPPAQTQITSARREIDAEEERFGYRNVTKRCGTHTGGDNYLDWMFTQKPSGSSGRLRPDFIPLRSSSDRHASENGSSTEWVAPYSVALARDGAALPLACTVSGMALDATTGNETGRGCVFTFDDSDNGDKTPSKVGRSASFTSDSVPSEICVTVHRSPSQPVTKRIECLSGDAQKPPHSLQISRVKKVSTLRSFGKVAPQEHLCQASSVDSLTSSCDLPVVTSPDLVEGDSDNDKALARSPLVLRRPQVPPLLHASCAQRITVSTDQSRTSPAKLRPAMLHPEFKTMVDQLEKSPLQPIQQDDSRGCCLHDAANNAVEFQSETQEASAPEEGCPCDDSIVDEGLDLSAASSYSYGLGRTTPHTLASISPDFCLTALDDTAVMKKKAGKRNHTHPPSTKSTDSAYVVDTKAKDTNGFSRICELKGDDADDVTGGMSAGLGDGNLPLPDSLYNSFEDVAGEADAIVASETSHKLSAAACTSVVTKSKRVKSDPFPESRPLAVGGSDAAATAASAGLERSPSDATHERSRSAAAGQLRSSVEGAASSSGDLASSSEGSGASLAVLGKGAHEQRAHIVNEIIEKEEIYVANLEQVTQAVSQLKEQDILDSSAVDKIFCNIRLPESRVHHKIFLESMRLVQRHWDASLTTVGDRIANMFSSQSVLENYMSYVTNCSKSKARLEQAFKTKPNFCKFNETFRRGNISRQDLRAVLSLPANHLISYRFFIERMLKYTAGDHPDYERLLKARCVVLDLLDKVGSQDSPDSVEAEKTLKKLETLLSIQDLAMQPDRVYLRNDSVAVKPGKREGCYLWMFSDIILLTFIKGSRINSVSGKLSHPRRGSMTVLSPRGQEVIEKAPHKLWMRLGLEEVDIVNSPEVEKRKCAKETIEAENDLERLVRISEETDALVMKHEKLQKNLLELMDGCNQRLSNLRLRREAIDMTSLQLLVGVSSGSGENAAELTIQFETADKRASWETTLTEAKLNLETALTDKMPPEFKDAIPITKTRSGMQFSCAAAIEGSAMRDVWICNSDSYVGHMCLLNLLPQPTVSMSAAVPSCTSRVLCICAVPASAASSQSRHGRRHCPSDGSSRQTITAASSSETLLGEDPIALFSTASAADDTQGYYDDGELSNDDCSSTIDDLCIHETTDLAKNLMWLGTEDGCIHIFNSEENLRTSRLRAIRLQLKASVLCIVFLEHSVFASLSNGSIIVYRRSNPGSWNLDCSEQPCLSSSGSSMTLPAPVTKMLAVSGKLWCSYQNEIVVLDPHSLKAEISFAASADRQRTVQSMVYSRHGIVAVAVQGSCDVRLFHAATRKFLGDVSVAAAVAHKLHGCDDIIRQHKAACLKITALLACKDSLWVGTTAGVILTLPLPKVTSNMANSREYTLAALPVTGLSIGHTGNVRFLLSIDMPQQPAAAAFPSPSAGHWGTTSSPTTPAATSVATKLLVISGGDGYENFDGSSVDGAVGSNDSVNHLLLWEL